MVPNTSRPFFPCRALLALCALWCSALAAPAAAVVIEYVPVGNAGNAGDPVPGYDVVYGAVAYDYYIGKYDVTVGQYTEFLNAVAKSDPYGLYNMAMASNLNIAGISRSGASENYSYSVIGSSANLPITYVSWGDAARFANWMHNGQPTGVAGAGTTETGAYTLNGATSNEALSAVPRNVDANVFLPSWDEWHKAAYYNPADSSYYQYPFSSDTLPTSAPPGNTPNTGNYYADFYYGFAVTGTTAFSSSQNYLTPVGAYTASVSPYGAYDMGGNVWQWNEANVGGPFRGLRGGSWIFFSYGLDASYGLGVDPANESNEVGFRLASFVPEPGSVTLCLMGALTLTTRRGRK